MEELIREPSPRRGGCWVLPRGTLDPSPASLTGGHSGLIQSIVVAVLLILAIFHGYYVYHMLLPLFMAFLVSRESHDFIIKSPIYRSMSDCKSESLSWLCCLHIVCLYCVTGIWRQSDQCQKYSLRLVVYTLFSEYFKIEEDCLNVYTYLVLYIWPCTLLLNKLFYLARYKVPCRFVKF